IYISLDQNLQIKQGKTKRWFKFQIVTFFYFLVQNFRIRLTTKTKGAFPNDNSLLKLLFMGIQNAQKKWTMPIRNWSLTISQLSIYF
ncbi:hypothetical protein MNY27_10435, partial [Sulfurimonas sp. NWX79]